MPNQLPDEYTPPVEAGVTGGFATATGKPNVPDHELLRCVGRGSYGEVWLARNVIGTYRAVKIVYRSKFEHERPYEREFNGIKKFEPISRAHEGLMDILQVGRNDQEQYFYYVMEVADDEVAGQDFDPAAYHARTLRSAINQRQITSFGESLELCLSLASALGHLHEHELVHRDIKPANIIFVNGVPKLADIGLVTDVGSESIAGGTMGYMAPEGMASQRADIYSLGKVFYEVMTGKDRFEFPELPVHWGDATDDEKFLELNEVVLKACESNPAQRYQSAEELRGDLVLLQTGRSVRRLRVLERRLGLLTRVGIGAAALGLIAAAAYYQIYREKAVTTRQLAGSYIAYGSRTMNEGDLLGSLPWLAKALSLGRGGADEEETDRVRMAAVLHQCPKILRMWFHDGLVQHARFSPDGRLVATAGNNGIVTIWDVEKDSMLPRLVGHSKEVEKLDFNSDGSRLVTGSVDGTARVWEMATGTELLVLPHPKTVYSARFNAQGDRIVTSCGDGRVRIWNARNGEFIKEFQAQVERGPVRHSAFSPDDKLIVTCGEDDTAQIWDWAAGLTIGQRIQHQDHQWIYYAAFSPDGRRVATASSDSRVYICEADTGRVVRVLEHGVPVRSVEWSPDGRWVVAACSDFIARVWDAESGKEVCPPLQHNSYVLHAAFSPDGGRVVTSTSGGISCVWDITPARQLPPPLVSLFHPHSSEEPSGRNNSVRFPNESFLADPVDDEFLELKLNRAGTRAVVLSFHSPTSLNKDWDYPVSSPATAQLWDARSWKPIAEAFHCTNAPWRSTISEDGQFLAVVPATNIVETWNTLKGRRLAAIPLVGEIASVVISPKADRLVTLVRDKAQAEVWDTITGAQLFVFPHDVSVRTAVFSPDGETIVTISGSSVFLWNATTGASQLVLLHESTVKSAAFSADGLRLVTGRADGSLAEREAQIWDLGNGHKIGAPMRHRDGIDVVTFSPDGQRVVTASEDFTAQVWSAITGLPISQLIRHKQTVYSAVFSPDGRWIVTASQDGTVRVWDAQTGEPVTPPLRQPWPVRNAQFTADGRHLVTQRRANADSRLLTLPGDARPVDELVALSGLLSGHQVDHNGGALPLTRGKLRETWERLRSGYLKEFASSKADVLRWHETETKASEQADEWFAAVFHLDYLLAARPEDRILHERRKHAQAKLESQQRRISRNEIP